jgi:hypothetical protein
MTFTMQYTDINEFEDIYYPQIEMLIKVYVPEFISIFEGYDEIYMILGEFGRFITDNIDDISLFNK